MKIITGGFILLSLVPVTVRDAREKTIDLRSVQVIILLSVPFLLLTEGDVFSVSGILGLMPGLALYGLSRIPGEPVGRGDGLIVMWLGYLIGIAAVAEVLVLAWGLAFFAALPKVLRHKKCRIPFVPFIFTAFSCLFFPMVYRMCG